MRDRGTSHRFVSREDVCYLTMDGMSHSGLLSERMYLPQVLLPHRTCLSSRAPARDLPTARFGGHQPDNSHHHDFIARRGSLVLGEAKKGTYTSRSSVVISRSPSWDGEVAPEREGEIAQHVMFIPHTMSIVSPPPLSIIFLPSSSIPYLLGRLSA
jgi:hypothetical protein